MDKAELLVRYETLAANRRHFELLFFAIVAFSALMALAIWTAVTALRPALSSLALLTSGVQLLAAAFIARRLLLRARSAFDAMTTAWRGISGEVAASIGGQSAPFGAMSVAVTGQAMAGAMLLATAVLSAI